MKGFGRGVHCFFNDGVFAAVLAEHTGAQIVPRQPPQHGACFADRVNNRIQGAVHPADKIAPDPFKIPVIAAGAQPPFLNVPDQVLGFMVHTVEGSQ